MPKKANKYNYPAGMICDYPADLPRPSDIPATQQWIISLQRDLASTHELLESLLVPSPSGEDFHAATKMLSFTQAKTANVLAYLPTMHGRVNVAAGRAYNSGTRRDLPLPNVSHLDVEDMTPPADIQGIAPFDATPKEPDQ